MEPATRGSKTMMEDYSSLGLQGRAKPRTRYCSWRHCSKRVHACTGEAHQTDQPRRCALDRKSIGFSGISSRYRNRSGLALSYRLRWHRSRHRFKPNSLTVGLVLLGIYLRASRVVVLFVRPKHCIFLLSQYILKLRGLFLPRWTELYTQLPRGTRHITSELPVTREHPTDSRKRSFPVPAHV